MKLLQTSEAKFTMSRRSVLAYLINLSVKINFRRLDLMLLKGKFHCMDDLLFGHTWIVGKGRFYSQTSFIYKNETLRGFIKGVSCECFLLTNK